MTNTLVNRLTPTVGLLTKKLFLLGSVSAPGSHLLKQFGLRPSVPPVTDRLKSTLRLHFVANGGFPGDMQRVKMKEALVG